MRKNKLIIYILLVTILSAKFTYAASEVTGSLDSSAGILLSNQDSSISTPVEIVSSPSNTKDKNSSKSRAASGRAVSNTSGTATQTQEPSSGNTLTIDTNNVVVDTPNPEEKNENSDNIGTTTQVDVGSLENQKSTLTQEENSSQLAAVGLLDSIFDPRFLIFIIVLLLIIWILVRKRRNDSSTSFLR